MDLPLAPRGSTLDPRMCDDAGDQFGSGHSVAVMGCEYAPALLLAQVLLRSGPWLWRVKALPALPQQLLHTMQARRGVAEAVAKVAASCKDHSFFPL